MENNNGIENGLQRKILNNTWRVFEKLEKHISGEMQKLILRAYKKETVSIDEVSEMNMQIAKLIYLAESEVLKPIIIGNQSEYIFDEIIKQHNTQNGKK